MNDELHDLIRTVILLLLGFAIGVVLGLTVFQP